MPAIYLMLTAVIVLSGVTMITLTLAYHSKYGKEHRIRDGKHGTANAKGFVPNAVVNSVLSISLVYGLTFVLRPYIFDEGAASVLRVVGEGVAMLLLYDFFYYLVHRYPFHAWRVLRAVHAKHHVVRNPSAIDSLYLHPIETFLGLSLLWICASLVGLASGPVSVYSFGWAFLVYSMLNVLVHSGLKMKVFPLSLITYVATRHDKHHANMKATNYASVTPLWDILLGTEET